MKKKVKLTLSVDLSPEERVEPTEFVSLAESSQTSSRDGLLQIGELATRVQLSQRTIHFYEKSGLITPTFRHDRGYRYYSTNSVERIETILRLKRIGLSIDEIRDVIELYFVDPYGITGKRRVIEILKSHLETTNSRIFELNQLRDEINKNIVKLELIVNETKFTST